MPYLNCESVRLYYEISGKGFPIIFIHGLGSSTIDWNAQVDFFSKNYQVIVYDLRGHGKSDKNTGPFNIPQFAKDTVCLLETLNIRKVHVVGISLGGMIGLHLAVYYSNIVKSLTIVNSPSEFNVKTIKDGFQVFVRFFIIKIMGMKRMGKFLSHRLFPKPEQEKKRKELAERWAQNDSKAYWKATKSLINWNITSNLDKITCPTLIVGAEFDYFPVQEKKVIASRIKNAQLQIIPDSRHGTPLDQTEIFNKIVSDFLKNNK